MRTTITPKKARELLKLNTRNRKLSKALVSKYAGDMRSGRWPYNGDPIRVSRDGVLLDGQHRLYACLEADASFEAELIEGLPDEVAMTIDGGRRRSAADVLNMLQGGSMASVGTAASAKIVLNYLSGVTITAQQSTPSIMTLLNEEPDVAAWHIAARASDRIILPSALGAVMFLGTRAATYEKRARQFLDPLLRGEGLEAGDPRLALRNGFLNKRLAGAKHVHPVWAFIATVQCWNAWVTDRRLEFLKVIPGRDGKLSIPNVLGGPKFGAGIQSLTAPKTKLRDTHEGKTA